jgi:hypothetical protein
VLHAGAAAAFFSAGRNTDELVQFPSTDIVLHRRGVGMETQAR